MDMFEGSKIALNGVEYLSGFPAFLVTSLMGGFMLYGLTEFVGAVVVLLAKAVRRISQ